MSAWRVGILTVSDRCSRGEAVDESGPAIRAELPTDQFLVVYCAIVPDEKREISAMLKRWSDEMACDIIITTGGTGLSPRDVTPEATRRVIDRDAPHLATYIAVEAFKSTPFAALGRGMAGVRDRTLIVNLPGSPSGARDGARVLAPILGHAASVLTMPFPEHPKSSGPDSVPVKSFPKA